MNPRLVFPVLAAFLGAPAFGLQLYYDQRKPKMPAFAQLLSGPVGWYPSPDAAWQAYQGWFVGPSGPAAYPNTYHLRVENFRPCPNQTAYVWGEPMAWCHDHYHDSYGPPGYVTTSVVEAIQACPEGYRYNDASVQPVSGNGTASSPRMYEYLLKTA